MLISRVLAATIFTLTFVFASAASYAATETFYFPKRPNQYGSDRLIFIDAVNADQFCVEEGYDELISGTVYCGEDESSYVTYDWYEQRWESKSTGSKNMCYPLFASMICSD